MVWAFLLWILACVIIYRFDMKENIWHDKEWKKKKKELTVEEKKEQKKAYIIIAIIVIFIVLAIVGKYCWL